MPTRAGESRSAELLRYVRFTAADAAALVRAGPRVRPHLERIAASFYERVRDQRAARLSLAVSEKAERVESTVVAWLDRLFCGVYDEAYFVRSEEIGRTHVRLGLAHHDVSIAMGILRSLVFEVLDEPSDAGARDALGRLLDVELAMMLDAHHEQLVAAWERTQQERRLTALGLLTTGLAHEIRNPLNGARLHAEFLERTLAAGGEPATLEAVSVVKGEIQRLARKVDEFLAFAQPKALVRGQVDVRALVERVAAGAPKVRTDVPAEVLLAGDATRLEQALRAMVTNAIEAGAEQVILRVRAEAQTVRIEIVDDGPGFGARAPVFDAFYTTKADGTGLGLAIVHRTVTDHGGTIDVESRPGYTRFRLSLPRTADGLEGTKA